MSSRSARVPAGSAGLRPPRMTGQTNRASSSTRPATRACAARFGPPTNRSVPAAAFSSRTALGVEMALEPGVRCGRRRHGRGVDDLARRLPCAGEVGHEVRPRGQGGVGLPHRHRLVHAPPVEVRACGPHELGDEREDLDVGRGPIEAAAFVLGPAVEGHVRRVDQLRHDRSPITSTPRYPTVGKKVPRAGDEFSAHRPSKHSCRRGSECRSGDVNVRDQGDNHARTPRRLHHLP